MSQARLNCSVSVQAYSGCAIRPYRVAASAMTYAGFGFVVWCDSSDSHQLNPALDMSQMRPATEPASFAMQLAMPSVHDSDHVRRFKKRFRLFGAIQRQHEGFLSSEFLSSLIDERTFLASKRIWERKLRRVRHLLRSLSHLRMLNEDAHALHI